MKYEPQIGHLVETTYIRDHIGYPITGIIVDDIRNMFLPREIEGYIVITSNFERVEITEPARWKFIADKSAEMRNLFN